MKPPSQTGCITIIIVVTALAVMLFFIATRHTTLDLGGYPSEPPTTTVGGSR